MAAACFLVSGRVQGVFFRAWTREQAQRLGLRGSAVNLADGRVRVIAEGTDQALERLQDWLRVGPPAARVEAVERQPHAGGLADGFTIG